MKTNKKLLITLTCLSAFISLFFIADTYAKYSTSANAESKIPIARWDIKINDKSIKNNSDFSETLAPIFPGNENIASNIIAPSAEGYFDLNLDFNDVDVSFNYKISIAPNKDSAVQDFIATGYSVNDGEIQAFKDSTNTIITEDIPLSSTERAKNIRIYIKWDDSDSSTMDNLQDTQATLSEDNLALLDVNIAVTQLANIQNTTVETNTEATNSVN